MTFSFLHNGKMWKINRNKNIIHFMDSMILVIERLYLLRQKIVLYFITFMMLKKIVWDIWKFMELQRSMELISLILCRNSILILLAKFGLVILFFCWFTFYLIPSSSKTLFFLFFKWILSLSIFNIRLYVCKSTFLKKNNYKACVIKNNIKFIKKNLLEW